ncbi:uncharacterized protein LOC105217001 [Zeugodacus cucurbitae]|uniref:uncharacterized protein LOC105217001 n=1 Tax=Zeugodacus cucurbitae TaxID=28588 RepID=UPI0023D935D4|nr:uncharacterized protein LOC105217001 [Zeugodacus cucurbitae]XP_054091094.1 uncharacterized protein LOC105217001 [Zeugodacus cucurbitae]XP_054091095.1 uncharacterized protein LOC105217001 [Zeugodacus cucurbitae]
MSQASNMRTNLGYFVVICVLGCYASAEDKSVDCTKPPPFVPLHMCCHVPDLSTIALKEQCAEFAKPPTPPPMGRGGPAKVDQSHPTHMHELHLHPCLIECIFNKTEVFGENGEPDVDKFSTLVDTTVKDNKELATSMKESFGTCAKKMIVLKANIAEEKSKNPEYAEKMAKQNMQMGCSPFGAILMDCVNMETFKNCPVSAWNDSTECNAVRDFIKECEHV